MTSENGASGSMTLRAMWRWLLYAKPKQPKQKPQEWCDLTYPHVSHTVNEYDSRYRTTLCRGIRPPARTDYGTPS